MQTCFTISDNPDDPFDPESWTLVSSPLPDRYDTLVDAFRAAVGRAARLAQDPSSTAHSVDVSMHLEGRGGMGVASVHVWWDHAPSLPYLPALEDQLDQ